MNWGFTLRAVGLAYIAIVLGLTALAGSASLLATGNDGQPIVGTLLLLAIVGAIYVVGERLVHHLTRKALEL